MNEAAVEEETMQSEEQVPTQGQATAGVLLRQAREAARMQLPVMAATLKVPQHKLEALEADDYAAFPDHVFMRALAMGMCRTLHIDAESVLAKLPRSEIKSLANAGPGINETVKVRSSFKVTGTPLDSGNSSSRKIAAGVLILLAAAAAVYFVPFHQMVDGADGAGAPAPAQAQSDQTAAVSASVAEPLAQAEGGAQGSSATPAAPVTESVSVAAAAGMPGDGAAASAPAASVAAAQTAAPATEAAVPVTGAAGLLVLKVNTGQSWVKVRDGAGKVVLEKTLSKDETATAEGQLPLSVIVGNAKGTQVTVRGEPFDISSTRDNVARFEVK